MDKFTRNDIITMFSNLCCSRCKNEFTIDSLEILEQNCDMFLCNLVCDKCGKDFGDVVFYFNRKSDKHMPFTVVEGPLPINSDDVLDAHRFIKENL